MCVVVSLLLCGKRSLLLALWCGEALFVSFGNEEEEGRRTKKISMRKRQKREAKNFSKMIVLFLCNKTTKTQKKEKKANKQTNKQKKKLQKGQTKQQHTLDTTLERKKRHTSY